MRHNEKPLLFLDIDGVLSLCGSASDSCPSRGRPTSRRPRFDFGHGSRAPARTCRPLGAALPASRLPQPVGCGRELRWLQPWAPVRGSIESEPGTLASILWHGRPLDDALRAGDIAIEGSKRKVRRFLNLFPLPEPAS
jgi:hypothetical protein